LGKLLGAPSPVLNEGWRLYFSRFDRVKKDIKAATISPEALAGGSDEEDMPWQ